MHSSGLDDEVRIWSKERHLASRIATIGAVRIGFNEFSDRETICRFVGRDCRVLAQSASLRLTLWCRFFGETFGAFTDLLKYSFKLLQLFWRDVVERTFDECRVPAK